MVVDKEAWYNVWADSLDMYDNNNEHPQQYVPYYISFVVDTSGSMSWNGRVQTAKEALKGFIDHITEKDSANLIKFTYSATKLCDFTNDKQTLLSCVDKLYAYGGTSVYSGLNLSISDFNTVGNDKEKVIVLICDGDVDVDENNSLIANAKEMNIKIYPVLIGSNSYSDSRLQGIANATGGIYFYKANLQNNNPFNFIRYKSDIESHYVTITGILIDKVKNQTKLEISSWGKEYYIDYDQLITFIKDDSSGLLCNIVEMKLNFNIHGYL